MHLLTLGLNHRTAPVALREQAAFTPDQLAGAVQSLASRVELSETAILSTCNRTEIYCHQTTETPDQVFHWLCDYGGLTEADLRASVYTLPDEQAVEHTFRVASGLDSMVLGEPQILGQMKQAFSTAHRAGTTGKILNRLFQQTFKVAKQVRTDTTIGANPVSVAFAAVDLARHIFTQLSEQTVLLIGAGETNELVARHLVENGVEHMMVANRSLERAKSLAARVACEAITLDDMPSRLAQADIVVTSTASRVPILGKGAMETALRARRHRPMFIVDLAVTRDVEPEVADLKDVFLYTVDDLENIVTTNRASRQEAASEAAKIIDLQVVHFMQWLQALDNEPTIRALRSKIDTVQSTELVAARQRLLAGDDPDTVLTQFAHSLSRKFAHDPSHALKQADEDGNTTLADAARLLFDLDR